MKQYNISVVFKDEDLFNLNEDVIEKVNEYLNKDEEITLGNVIITDDNDEKWYVVINKVVNDDVYITLSSYKNSNQYNKKSKYAKHFFKQSNDLNIIKTIGLNNAKMIHANDEVSEIYIPLKEFLNKNKQAFAKQELYIKDSSDNYQLLRHKNLFSEYVDEISDFERFTYMYRNENGIIKISSKDDVKILEYDYLNADLLERKFAREFAKLIFQNKSGFKDKELISFLKDQLIFLKVEQTITKDNKKVWDKVEIENMKHNTLEKEQERLFKERKKNKVKYYKSKREVKRHKRHNLKHELFNEIKDM